MPQGERIEGPGQGMSRRQMFEVVRATAGGLLLASIAGPRAVEAHHDRTERLYSSSAFYPWPEPRTGYPVDLRAGLPSDNGTRLSINGWPMDEAWAARTYGWTDWTRDPSHYRQVWDGNMDDSGRPVPAWAVDISPRTEAIVIPAALAQGYYETSGGHVFSFVAGGAEPIALGRGFTIRICDEPGHLATKKREMEERVGHPVTPIGFDP